MAVKMNSCGCPDLATWHPGQIQHKFKCPKFRKLNPTLTVKQFMTAEGFPGYNGPDVWPTLVETLSGEGICLKTSDEELSQAVGVCLPA